MSIYEKQIFSCFDTQQKQTLQKLRSKMGKGVKFHKYKNHIFRFHYERIRLWKN